MSETSTGKIVSFTFDVKNPPPLTQEQRDELDALRDRDIDLSDIPEQSGKPFWHPGRHPDGGAAVRQAALQDGLLMLEPDVVEFFKQSGDGSAERMHAVLREYVETHRKSA